MNVSPLIHKHVQLNKIFTYTYLTKTKLKKILTKVASTVNFLQILIWISWMWRKHLCLNKYLNDFADLWNLEGQYDVWLNTKNKFLFTYLKGPNVYMYYPIVRRTRFFFDKDIKVLTNLLVYHIESHAIIILKL